MDNTRLDMRGSRRRAHAHLKAAALLSTLALASPAVSQVIVNPNQIVGTFSFSNTNPAILDVLHGPLDTPPGANEGIFRLDVSAASQAPAPPLTHATHPDTDLRTVVAYEVTVESGPPGSGIAYDVTARAWLTDWEFYHFAGAPSAPVEEEPAPDVTVNASECAALLDIKWRDLAGNPVGISNGRIDVYEELDPIGSGAFSIRNQAWKLAIRTGTSQLYMAVRGEDLRKKRVVLSYDIGSDPLSDLITLEYEIDVVTPCDEIVEILILVVDPRSSTGPPLPKIIGEIDVLGEEEHDVEGLLNSIDITRVAASRGPFGNGRLDWLRRTPSSGLFELENLLPSDFVQPEVGYIVDGAVGFRKGHEYQYLRLPMLGSNSNSPRLRVYMGDVLDLGNTFVIDPGYVDGDIFLLGPPPTELPSGVCLADIVQSTDTHDRDFDGIPESDTENLQTSSVSAHGSDQLAPGAQWTASRGLARASYSGGYDPLSEAYRGDYELVLGGLLQQPSLWNVGQLNVHLIDQNLVDPFAYQVSGAYITSRDRSAQLVEAGSRATVPEHYCMSQVHVNFGTKAGTFRRPRASGYGTFDGIDFERQPRIYDLTVWGIGTPTLADPASDTGLVVLCMPQGRYSLDSSVQTVNPGSGTSHTALPPFDLVVGCRQVIFVTTDMQLAVDPPVCTDVSRLSLPGEVQSDVDVERIDYTLNGGPTTSICTSCGIDPSFTLALDLKACENRIEIIAEDGDGNQASVTSFVRYDPNPPVIAGCGDITAFAPIGQTSVPVDYTVKATDDCSAAVSLACSPASGSPFPVGTTNVTCSATDGCGNTAECSFDVTVRTCAGPGADFVSDAPKCINGCEGIRFTDLSTGSPAGWQWDFGDGQTSAEQHPTHVYNTPGDYVVTLVIDNGCGISTTTQVVTVTAAARAEFTSDDPQCAGAVTTFTDLSAGSPSGWSWDFGDGGMSTAQNPTHTYTDSGTYVVTLSASNSCPGVSLFEKTVTVLGPPTAGFASNSPQCGLTLELFDASSDGPSSWRWDFGDTTTSTLQNPVHTYATEGSYTVSLTASNACGTSSDYVGQVWVGPSLGSGFDDWRSCQLPRGPGHGRPGTTDITDTARRVWEFDMGSYCPNPPCAFAMYVVADCGSALKIPLDDVEAGSIKIFNLFEDRYELLTAASTGGWSDGPAELIEWQDCAGTDPRWNDEITTVEFSGSPSVCGVFRLEFTEDHGGFLWDLFTNCDGTGTPGFMIFDNVCDALDAYNPLPELAIRNVAVAGACPAFEVTTEVVNTGCVAASVPVRITNTLDGGSETVIMPKVLPGETRTTTTSITVSNCVDGTFTAEVDPLDVVVECTESVGSAVACDPSGGVGDVAISPQITPCDRAPTFCGLTAARDLDPCSNSGVELTWTAATDYGSGTGVTYTVLRDGVPVATGLTGLSHVDLPGDTLPHDYMVIAVNDPCGLASAATPVVTAADANGGPGPPDSIGNTLRAVRRALTVLLEWTDAPGAVDYTVRRGVDRTLVDLDPPSAEIARVVSPLRYADENRLLATPDLDFYQIRGVDCAGAVGP